MENLNEMYAKMKREMHQSLLGEHDGVVIPIHGETVNELVEMVTTEMAELQNDYLKYPVCVYNFRMLALKSILKLLTDVYTI